MARGIMAPMQGNTTATAPEGADLFDRARVRANRARAAAHVAKHDFLMREVGSRLAERLEDVKRRFPLALDLGGRDGSLGEALGARGGVHHLITAEPAEAMLRRAPGAGRVVADEERLPFGNETLDLVLSNLSLHWVNDLPGALIQIRRALKPDGLFLGAMLGGDTLIELRTAWLMADADSEGGASPRVSPFTSVQDAGGLMQRAGFALPVIDIDTITVSYENALALMRELRAMGEGNALHHRSHRFTRRTTLMAAAHAYQDQFADADGRISATFQVIYLTGWAPHESQQKPARRGSGAVSLADALGDKSEP
jgi:SAM-dependent methyltransferase